MIDQLPVKKIEKVVIPQEVKKCKCGVRLFRKDIVQDNDSGLLYRCPKCFEVCK